MCDLNRPYYRRHHRPRVSFGQRRTTITTQTPHKATMALTQQYVDSVLGAASLERTRPTLSQIKSKVEDTQNVLIGWEVVDLLRLLDNYFWDVNSAVDAAHDGKTLPPSPFLFFGSISPICSSFFVLYNALLILLDRQGHKGR